MTVIQIAVKKKSTGRHRKADIIVHCMSGLITHIYILSLRAWLNGWWSRWNCHETSIADSWCGCCSRRRCKKAKQVDGASVSSLEQTRKYCWHIYTHAQRYKGTSEYLYCGWPVMIQSKHSCTCYCYWYEPKSTFQNTTILIANFWINGSELGTNGRIGKRILWTTPASTVYDLLILPYTLRTDKVLLYPVAKQTKKISSWS